MQRIVIRGACQAAWEDVETPGCPDDGVLVRARLTAISTGTELRVYRAIPVDEAGQFLHERVPMVLPTENGYSMVGDVVEVGARAAGISVGQRVYVPAPHKQFAAMRLEQVTPLPDDLPDEQAVFLNILEVGHLALRRGAPLPGANVAVVGQGVIGLSALAYCRAYGMNVVAIDPQPARREMADRMGANLTLSPDDPALEQQVAEQFGVDGADVVVEAASNWDAIRTAMQVARPEGTVVVAARHTRQPNFNPVGHPFLGKRLTLLTSYGHESPGSRWDRQRSIAVTLRLLREGRLTVEPMITHRIGWEEIPDVYQRLHEGAPEMVGIVARWDE